MTDEEILKAAQTNASKDGEAELYALKRAVIVGAVAMLVSCIILMVIKEITHKFDFAELVIMFFFEGISYLYYGKRISSRKHIIFGIILSILGFLCFILFLGVMLK